MTADRSPTLDPLAASALRRSTFGYIQVQGNTRIKNSCFTARFTWCFVLHVTQSVCMILLDRRILAKHAPTVVPA